MNVWKFLLNIIKHCKFWFIASVILSIIPPSLSAVGHIYYARIISYITEGYTSPLASNIIRTFIVLGAIYFTQNLIDGLRTLVDARVKIRYQRLVHTIQFKHLHKHSSNFFNTEQTGRILAKNGNLVFGVQRIFVDIRMFIFPHTAFFLTSAFLLCRISIFLGTILTILYLIEIVINYFLYQKLKKYAKTSAAEESVAAGYLVDSIANARLVKNSAALYHEKHTLRQKLNTFLRAKITESKVGGRSNFEHTLVFLIFNLSYFSTIIFFYYHSNLTIENIILAVSLIIRLSYHSFDTAQIFDRLQTNLGSINDAIDLLYRPFEITDTPHAKALKIKENSVEFKNATFSYKKNSPLFNKLNLTIAPNEKIGLVGVSGSGKSTLINLILRAFDLKFGKILISGQDISKVTQYSLHRNIALISQEPTLFNRSIMENIRFAKPKATDEEVYRAAKLAHIHDVIMTMPNGYNSIIGERGVKLSGGERQRIAIAAAILKDTPILILDEATSALDSQSEVAIEKALKNIMQNKTVIAIAHRLSTLKNMDRIIVLDNGKIIEQGSEKELLKNKSGTFSHLYKLQSDGYLTDK